MASKKRRRHTPDQIIHKLAERNKRLGAGQELSEVCPHLEITVSTWYRWVAQYGGMKARDAKRLKELEAENSRLKKLVANQALVIQVDRHIDADCVVDVLDRMALPRHPAALPTTDQSSSPTPSTTGARFNGTGSLFIDPGALAPSDVAAAAAYANAGRTRRGALA